MTTKYRLCRWDSIPPVNTTTRRLDSLRFSEAHDDPSPPASYGESEQEARAAIRNPLSRFESFPAEIMRMIVLNLDPADTLAFKLVSKTAFASLRSPEGKDLFPEEEMSSEARMAGMHRIEMRWHKPTLDSLFCHKCTIVQPVSEFPDSQRWKGNRKRRCLSCISKPHVHNWESIAIDGELHTECGFCDTKLPMSKLRLLPIKARKSEIRRHICDDCSEGLSHKDCGFCGYRFESTDLKLLPDKIADMTGKTWICAICFSNSGAETTTKHSLKDRLQNSSRGIFDVTPEAISKAQRVRRTADMEAKRQHEIPSEAKKRTKKRHAEDIDEETEVKAAPE